MVEAKNRPLSLQEFLALPEGEPNLELIDGAAVAKISPGFVHARLQVVLGGLLETWGRERGWVGTEWAVLLTGQSFNALAAKATDYLAAGVERVWVIHPAERTLTVFFADRAPRTLSGEQPIADLLFPGLGFSVVELIRRAGVPET
jgi:Uma2 family endonuclease